MNGESRAKILRVRPEDQSLCPPRFRRLQAAPWARPVPAVFQERNVEKSSKATTKGVK